MNDYENYLKKRFKPRTSLNDLNVLKLFNNWLDEQKIAVLELQTEDILNYIHYCREKGNKHSSIQVKLQSIRHYFDYLYHNKIIPNNPMQHLTIKTQAQSILSDLLEESQLDYIYNHYKGKTKTHHRNKIILSLAIYQALSVKDLAGLKVEHLDLDQGEINLPGHSRGKARKLQLKSFQIIELHNYLTVFRPKLLQTRKGFYGQANDDLILTSRKGFNFKDIRQQFTIDLRKQFPFFKSFQQIRRSVIVLWLKPYNLRQVQYMAGHGSIQTTEKYTISQIDDLKEEVNKFHPLK